MKKAGLVENMTSWECPDCGAHTDLYEPAGPKLSVPGGIEQWGAVPFDPRLARGTDEGEPFVISHPDAPAARGLRALAARLVTELEAP